MPSAWRRLASLLGVEHMFADVARRWADGCHHLLAASFGHSADDDRPARLAEA
jgi:hypothetical protein